MTTTDDGELCIWGLGLIGYSLAGALARAGRPCVVIDVDPERVARLNRGELPFHHLPHLPDDFGTEVLRGTLRATTDVTDALQSGHAVHILCVPTEANGVIDASALRDVVMRLAEGALARPLHLIIESTIAPVWLDSVVHRVLGDAGWRRGLDYHVGVSPRRDWLTNRERDMASTPKVIGGESPEIVALMRRLYTAVCDEVFEARDARHAAMVKVVENYFRYRDILLACELSLALPDFDVADILRLASTKWNMDLYHPSFGIGGYCVPLAKDYLGTEPRAQGAVADFERVEKDLFSALRQTVWAARAGRPCCGTGHRIRLGHEDPHSVSVAPADSGHAGAGRGGVRTRPALLPIRNSGNHRRSPPALSGGTAAVRHRDPHDGAHALPDRGRRHTADEPGRCGTDIRQQRHLAATAVQRRHPLP
ncbi:UDP-N-acetyl-D-mannosaminuronate dehydrogenase [Streptomyces rishiriensis]|uniref:UDP-N-acetyl-D-mannosaminuronate dehydrogenase n=1 Tax=Streptomyces rishiriensis TaxID=68264 RepID=A0ABU0NRC3_STRRH|nr:hypothetical protein [Streptomyces rishiriensis]MDQ0581273.1 UDP-N-acetyl-D-mannosaminuronate dehydrogenase [Streptomyces rishiriensis]